eukprot:gnl/TRDRNA2_/TRDRNA2_190792_c0_seq1.p1 gnl/TRDRNA2_/TRDRNA2_190792_c0~~gnl/TRDRNA2_/TRDRNA2_190792_c0_seq1.p1  ORF type:complete len:203 (+),score=48.87 gnl/TRDRNA2_/TRDRNA2_190792_c0_seq1:143-751(+)
MSALDALVGYLLENDSLQELEAFISTNCASFPATDGEQTHECFLLYRQYEEMVRVLLADFVDESRRDLNLIGLGAEATVEGLVEALCAERAERRPGPNGDMMRALIAITSFEEFAAESRRRCQELGLAPHVCAPVAEPVLSAEPEVSQGAAHGTVEVQVAVPEGVFEGQLLSVDYGGLRYEVPVPAGCAPGSVFAVALQVAV